MIYKYLRVVVVAVLLFVLAGMAVSAQNVTEQKNRKARLEKEIALLDKQLSDNADKSRSAVNSLTLLRQKISSKKELVAESDREIAVISGRIASKDREIRQMQDYLDTLSLYYSRLVKNAYINRDSKIWYMYILASDNLGQALRRMAYMKNLSSNLTRQGERIRDAKMEMEREMDSLAVLRSEAQVLRNKRVMEVKALQVDETQAQNLVNQLNRNKSKYQKELSAKKRQVEALNREIERLIASTMGGSSKSKTQIDVKLDAEFAKNKGKLPWPADGPVVDRFGQHYHPVFKAVKLPFNNGINIALAKGTSVRAVFNGVVKQIVVMPGYNKCVLVQHGNYFSFYCKLGAVDVKAGDKVNTGDIIGTVDTIDGMTQLHFQIWQGKAPQNPESWLR